jgi:hypothetical protein
MEKMLSNLLGNEISNQKTGDTVVVYAGKGANPDSIKAIKVGTKTDEPVEEYYIKWPPDSN